MADILTIPVDTLTPVLLYSLFMTDVGLLHREAYY